MLASCGENLTLLSPLPGDASSSLDGEAVDGPVGVQPEGAALIDASSSDAGFCAPTSDLLFCSTFSGPQPESGWSRKNLAGGSTSTLTLDSTSFISPPTSLASSARGTDDGFATLSTQVQQDPADPEGRPFSIDFDFRTGPTVVPNGSGANLFSLNFKDVPNRLVRLHAMVDGTTLRLGLRDIINTKHVQLPLAELNAWTHARFEVRRDFTVDAGTGEPVFKVTVSINNDTNPKAMHVATDAFKTGEPFDVDLGVDKLTISDGLLFHAQFDNFRIQRLN